MRRVRAARFAVLSRPSGSGGRDSLSGSRPSRPKLYTQSQEPSRTDKHSIYHDKELWNDDYDDLGPRTPLPSHSRSSTTPPTSAMEASSYEPLDEGYEASDQRQGNMNDPAWDFQWPASRDTAADERTGHAIRRAVVERRPELLDPLWDTPESREALCRANWRRLIKAYGDLGCLEQARTVWEAAPPGLASWNALLTARTRAGETPEWAAVMAELRDLRLAPNDRTFHILLGVASRNGQMAEMKSLLGEMAASGICATVDTTLIVIQACLRVGRLPAALRVIDGLAALGNWLRAPDWEAALLQCCESRHFPFVAELHSRMVAAGIRPNDRGYRLLIEAYCATDDCESLARLHDQMVTDEHLPSPASLRLMVAAAARAPGSALLVSLVRWFLANPVLLTERTVAIRALEGCVTHSLAEEAEDLVAAMVKSGHVPPEAPIWWLVETYKATSRPKAVSALLAAWPGKTPAWLMSACGCAYVAAWGTVTARRGVEMLLRDLIEQNLPLPQRFADGLKPLHLMTAALEHIRSLVLRLAQDHRSTAARELLADQAYPLVQSRTKLTLAEYDVLLTHFLETQEWERFGTVVGAIRARHISPTSVMKDLLPDALRTAVTLSPPPTWALALRDYLQHHGLRTVGPEVLDCRQTLPDCSQTIAAADSLFDASVTSMPMDATSSSISEPYVDPDQQIGWASAPHLNHGPCGQQVIPATSEGLRVAYNNAVHSCDTQLSERLVLKGVAIALGVRQVRDMASLRYCVLLHTGAGALNDAWQAIRELTAAGGRLDGPTAVAFASALGSAQRGADLMSLASVLKDMGLLAEQEVFAALTASLPLPFKPEDVDQLMGTLPATDRRGHHFAAVISAHLRASDVRRASTWFNNMREEGHPVTGDVLRELVTAHLHTTGLAAAVEYVLNYSSAVDRTLIETVLDAAASDDHDGNALTQLLPVVLILASVENPLPVKLYNRILAAYIWDSKSPLDDATRWIDAQPHLGVVADGGTYTHMISIQCLQLDTADVARLLREMRERGISPHKSRPTERLVERLVILYSRPKFAAEFPLLYKELLDGNPNAEFTRLLTEVARKLGHLPAATTPEMVLHHFGRMLNRRPPATTAQWLEEVAVEESPRMPRFYMLVVMAVGTGCVLWWAKWRAGWRDRPAAFSVVGHLFRNRMARHLS